MVIPSNGMNRGQTVRQCARGLGVERRPRAVRDVGLRRLPRLDSYPLMCNPTRERSTDG
jgi:hypothetical protein